MMFRILPDNLKFDGFTLVTGFHGIGVTGYWSIKYMIQNLKARRIGIIDTDKVSPVSSTANKSIVTPFELYRKDNLIFFKTEIQPLQGYEIHFYRELCDWIIKSKFKEVVLIGGLDASLQNDKSMYRLVHTSAYKPKKNLKGALILESDRLIVGPVALMLNYFEAMFFPSYAILPYASAERVDPRAAATSVVTISDHYSLNINVESLIKGAEDLESQIAQNQSVKPPKRPDSFYT